VYVYRPGQGLLPDKICGEFRFAEGAQLQREVLCALGPDPLLA
jgi:hypothetical protein